MKDAEILTHFDGRGRAEFLLGGFEATASDKITAMAYEFGYDLHSTEVPSKSVMRLIFVRNDSPTARQRAWQTHDRLRAGGPLLAVWGVPGAQPGTVRPVSAVEMASARRGLTAYETNGIKGLVALVALLGFGCLILAWVFRDALGVAVGLLMAGIALAVVAALIPRWMRRWYEEKRRLVQLYDQQRSGHVGPPPPPPPPPPGPADQYRGEGGGL